MAPSPRCTKAPAVMIALKPRNASSQPTLTRATAVTGAPISSVILAANRPRVVGGGMIAGIKAGRGCKVDCGSFLGPELVPLRPHIILADHSNVILPDGTV